MLVYQLHGARKAAVCVIPPNRLGKANTRRLTSENADASHVGDKLKLDTGFSKVDSWLYSSQCRTKHEADFRTWKASASCSMFGPRMEVRPWSLSWRWPCTLAARSFRSGSRNGVAPLYSTKHRCLPRKIVSSETQTSKDKVPTLQRGLPRDKIIGEMMKIAYKIKKDQWIKKTTAVETNAVAVSSSPAQSKITHLASQLPRLEKASGQSTCDLVCESKHLKELKKRIRQRRMEVEVNNKMHSKSCSSCNSITRINKKIMKKETIQPKLAQSSSDSKEVLPSPYFFIQQSLNKAALKTTFALPSCVGNTKPSKPDSIHSIDDKSTLVDCGKMPPCPRLLSQDDKNISNKIIKQTNPVSPSIPKKSGISRSVDAFKTENESKNKNEDNLDSYPSPCLKSLTDFPFEAPLQTDAGKLFSNFCPVEITNLNGVCRFPTSSKTAVYDSFLRKSDQQIRRKLSSMKLSKEIVIFKGEANDRKKNDSTSNRPSKRKESSNDLTSVKKRPADDVQKSNFSSLTPCRETTKELKNNLGNRAAENRSASGTSAPSKSLILISEDCNKTKLLQVTQNIERVQELCTVLTDTSQHLSSALCKNIHSNNCNLNEITLKDGLNQINNSSAKKYNKKNDCSANFIFAKKDQPQEIKFCRNIDNNTSQSLISKGIPVGLLNMAGTKSDRKQFSKKDSGTSSGVPPTNEVNLDSKVASLSYLPETNREMKSVNKQLISNQKDDTFRQLYIGRNKLLPADSDSLAKIRANNVASEQQKDSFISKNMYNNDFAAQIAMQLKSSHPAAQNDLRNHKTLDTSENNSKMSDSFLLNRLIKLGRVQNDPISESDKSGLAQTKIKVKESTQPSVTDNTTSGKSDEYLNPTSIKDIFHDVPKYTKYENNDAQKIDSSNVQLITNIQSSKVCGDPYYSTRKLLDKSGGYGCQIPVATEKSQIDSLIFPRTISRQDLLTDRIDTSPPSGQSFKELPDPVSDSGENYNSSPKNGSVSSRPINNLESDIQLKYDLALKTNTPLSLRTDPGTAIDKESVCKKDNMSRKANLREDYYHMLQTSESSIPYHYFYENNYRYDLPIREENVCQTQKIREKTSGEETNVKYETGQHAMCLERNESAHGPSPTHSFSTQTSKNALHGAFAKNNLLMYHDQQLKIDDASSIHHQSNALLKSKIPFVKQHSLGDTFEAGFCPDVDKKITNLTSAVRSPCEKSQHTFFPDDSDNCTSMNNPAFRSFPSALPQKYDTSNAEFTSERLGNKTQRPFLERQFVDSELLSEERSSLNNHSLDHGQPLLRSYDGVTGTSNFQENKYVSSDIKNKANDPYEIYNGKCTHDENLGLMSSENSQILSDAIRTTSSKHFLRGGLRAKRNLAQDTPFPVGIAGRRSLRDSATDCCREEEVFNDRVRLGKYKVENDPIETDKRLLRVGRQAPKEILAESNFKVENTLRKNKINIANRRNKHFIDQTDSPLSTAPARESNDSFKRKMYDFNEVFPSKLRKSNTKLRNRIDQLKRFDDDRASKFSNIFKRDQEKLVDVHLRDVSSKNTSSRPSLPEFLTSRKNEASSSPLSMENNESYNEPEAYELPRIDESVNPSQILATVRQHRQRKPSSSDKKFTPSVSSVAPNYNSKLCKERAKDDNKKLSSLESKIIKRDRVQELSVTSEPDQKTNERPFEYTLAEESRRSLEALRNLMMDMILAKQSETNPDKISHSNKIEKAIKESEKALISKIQETISSNKGASNNKTNENDSLPISSSNNNAMIDKMKENSSISSSNQKASIDKKEENNSLPTSSSNQIANIDKIKENDSISSSNRKVSIEENNSVPISLPNQEKIINKPKETKSFQSQSIITDNNRKSLKDSYYHLDKAKLYLEKYIETVDSEPLKEQGSQKSANLDSSQQLSYKESPISDDIKLDSKINISVTPPKLYPLKAKDVNPIIQYEVKKTDELLLNAAELSDSPYITPPALEVSALYSNQANAMNERVNVTPSSSSPLTSLPRMTLSDDKNVITDASDSSVLHSDLSNQLYQSKLRVEGQAHRSDMMSTQHYQTTFNVENTAAGTSSVNAVADNLAYNSVALDSTPASNSPPIVDASPFLSRVGQEYHEFYSRSDSTGAIDSVAPFMTGDTVGPEQLKLHSQISPLKSSHSVETMSNNLNINNFRITSLSTAPSATVSDGPPPGSVPEYSVLPEHIINSEGNKSDFLNAGPTVNYAGTSPIRRAADVNPYNNTTTYSSSVAEHYRASGVTDTHPPEISYDNSRTGAMSSLLEIPKNITGYWNKMWKNNDEKFIAEHPAYPATTPKKLVNPNITPGLGSLRPPSPFENMKNPLSPFMDKVSTDRSYVINMLENPIKTLSKAAFARRVKSNAQEVGICSPCMKISQLSSNLQKGMPFLRNQKMNYNYTYEHANRRGGHDDGRESCNIAREIYDKAKSRNCDKPVDETLLRIGERVKESIYAYKRPAVKKKPTESSQNGTATSESKTEVVSRTKIGNEKRNAQVLSTVKNSVNSVKRSITNVLSSSIAQPSRIKNKQDVTKQVEMIHPTKLPKKPQVTEKLERTGTVMANVMENSTMKSSAPVSCKTISKELSPVKLELSPVKLTRLEQKSAVSLKVAAATSPKKSKKNPYRSFSDLYN